MRDNFKYGEQEVLDNLSPVIQKLTKDLNVKGTPVEPNIIDTESGMTESRGYARVLTPSGISKPHIEEERPSSPYSYNNGIDGDVTKTSGASYVLIVAAIIALIIVVYVVSTTIINMIPNIADFGLN